MDHFKTCVEQLDLAAQQLHQDNPAYRRFALILTDNIVELMCYDRCKRELNRADIILEGFDHAAASTSPANYFSRLHSHKQKLKDKRIDVLDSKKFRKPLNYLSDKGILTGDDQTFIRLAHDFRNESYHAGIVHDDIMHALAWHYHRVACDLFVSLQPSRDANPAEEKSHAWEKHGVDELLYWDMNEAEFRRVATSLGNDRPQPEPNLAEALATSLLSRISEIQDAIDLLVRDSPKKLTENDAIRDIQFWDAYGKGFSGEPILVGEPECAGALQQALNHCDYMSKEWQPEYRKSPLPRWIERSDRLRKEVNSAKALQAFDCLDKEISPFAVMAFDSAQSLGEYIDELIDRRKEDAAFGAG